MALNNEQKKFLYDNFTTARSNFSDERKSILYALLLVITGMLLLSVDFLQAIEEKTADNLANPWILICAWFFMLMSVATYIASSHSKAYAEGEVMNELNEKIVSDSLPDTFTPGRNTKTLSYVRWADRFLWSTYFLAALGGSMFLLYASGTLLAQYKVTQSFTQHITEQTSSIPTGLPSTGFEPHY